MFDDGSDMKAGTPHEVPAHPESATEKGSLDGDSTSLEHMFDSPLAGALACAERGWPVLPVMSPEADHKDRGKASRPGFAWTRKSSTDPDVIHGLDLDGRGENYGVYAAGADLIILDEDKPGAIDEWAAHLGITFPPTFTVASGRAEGGRHLYWEADGATFTQRDAWPGVNVRHRGYVVGPGSVHPETGALYTVTDGRDPVPLPAEAVEALLAEPDPVDEPTHPVAVVSDEEARYALDIYRRNLDDLEALMSLSDGDRDYRGHGWDSGTMHYAARGWELVNATGGRIAPERFEADFMRLIPTEYTTQGRRKLAGACSRVGDRRATTPSPAENVFTALDPVEAAEHAENGGKRHLVVQRASEIQPRRVLWLWDGRMPVGALSLLAGREGLGKSSLMAWLIAQVTRGTLPGNLHGHPRAVIIAATEDSWEHTLVPRLMAAGADLHLVLRVDVMTSKGFTVDLSLPDDIPAVKELAEQEGVALMVLDPLMSRLHNLDTHKDAEVRIALEPLVRMADETGMALVGLIHLNKSSNDPLNAVMGSKAFTAVARSVSTVVPDDSDEEDRRRLFGTVKNNLGPALAASQVYTIDTAEVQTPDGPTPVGKLVWHGEVDTTIKAAMADTGMDSRTAVGEAQVWLYDVLSVETEPVARKDVMASAKKAGISESALKRAAKKLEVVSTEGSTFPRTTHWSLPEPFDADAPGEDS